MVGRKAEWVFIPNLDPSPDVFNALQKLAVSMSKNDAHALRAGQGAVRHPAGAFRQRVRVHAVSRQAAWRPRL